MHFQHVALGLFARITKHALENHRNVSHQIDRIVVHDHLPGEIQLFLGFCFLFNRRIRQCAANRNEDAATF